MFGDFCILRILGPHASARIPAPGPSFFPYLPSPELQASSPPMMLLGERIGIGFSRSKHMLWAGVGLFPKGQGWVTFWCHAFPSPCMATQGTVLAGRKTRSWAHRDGQIGLVTPLLCKVAGGGGLWRGRDTAETRALRKIRFIKTAQTYWLMKRSVSPPNTNLFHFL